MSRTVSADAALRAGGSTGDVMLDEEPAVAGADGLRIGIGLGLGLGLGSTGDVLDEEPAVAGADGLRIGITLRASSSSSSRGIGGVTLGQTTFFSLTGTE